MASLTQRIPLSKP